MKMTVTPLEGYNKEKGLKVGKSTVMQFIAGTPEWVDLLKPVGEEVEEDYDSLYDIVLNELNEDDNLVNTEEEEQSVDDFEKQTLATFEPNKSVCGIGVDMDSYRENQSHLDSLQCPVFIYVNTKSWSVSTITEWVSENVSHSMSPFVILGIDLELDGQLDLVAFLKEKGYHNVRLVGEKVIKLRGAYFAGLYPKKLVKSCGLTYFYLNNFHPTTQVNLVAEGATVVACKLANYPDRSPKVVASPKASKKGSDSSSGGSKGGSKGKSSTGVSKRPKTPSVPKKAKPSRRALFRG